MKLSAEISNQKLAVEIKRDGDKVLADVDGRRYELEVSEPEPNVFLLKQEGRIYEAWVEPPPTPTDPFQTRIGDRDFEVLITDPKRLRSAGTDQEHGDGLAEIKTAMPGKVVRIIVEAGAEVKKGDGIIVVEAMKMQNEIRSPKDGTVKEIRVTEGSTVNAGEILVVIE
ncbi:MAG: biotin/lipoyl-containing protein [Acidobacteriota bacterium]